MKKLNITTINNNHLNIQLPNGERHLYSYDTLVAVITAKGIVHLDKKYWNYSVTTSKNRNLFLGENTSDTKAKIESKEYKLKELN